ncbi:MAG: hypothetical protein AB9835_14350 [Eubacteriales bacterium]
MAELTKDITVNVQVDTTELDTAIEKAKTLNELQGKAEKSIPEKMEIALNNLVDKLVIETETRPTNLDKVACLIHEITVLYPFTRNGRRGWN